MRFIISDDERSSGKGRRPTIENVLDNRRKNGKGVEGGFGVAACVWWYSKSVLERMWVAEKTRTGKGSLVVNSDVYCRGGGCH